MAPRGARPSTGARAAQRVADRLISPENRTFQLDTEYVDIFHGTTPAKRETTPQTKFTLKRELQGERIATLSRLFMDGLIFARQEKNDYDLNLYTDAGLRN
jgi:hypothetical protein